MSPPSLPLLLLSHTTRLPLEHPHPNHSTQLSAQLIPLAQVQLPKKEKTFSAILLPSRLVLTPREQVALQSHPLSSASHLALLRCIPQTLLLSRTQQLSLQPLMIHGSSLEPPQLLQLQAYSPLAHPMMTANQRTLLIPPCQCGAALTSSTLKHSELMPLLKEPQSSVSKTTTPHHPPLLLELLERLPFGKDPISSRSRPLPQLKLLTPLI